MVETSFTQFLMHPLELSKLQLIFLEFCNQDVKSAVSRYIEILGNNSSSILVSESNKPFILRNNKRLRLA